MTLCGQDALPREARQTLRRTDSANPSGATRATILKLLAFQCR